MHVKSVSLLWDVQNACKRVLQFMEGMSEAEYAEDALVQSAVERQLEIVGEALNALRKSDLKVAERIPDYRRLIGLRNILIHGYAAVDDAVVYAAATKRVPDLLATTRELLADRC